MDGRREGAALACEVARAAARPGALRTIVLDVDGTLAPIAAAPEAAHVPEKTLQALSGLVETGWTVVVVSGRAAGQARAMVPVPGVRVFGSHGLEHERGRRRAAPSRKTAERFSALAAAAKPLIARFPGARVEVKPAGLAFHDRGIAAGDLPRWRRALRGFLDSVDTSGFEALRGRRVVELRPLGASKGNVLRELAPRNRRDGSDASLVVVGDDTTDEDMFREVLGRGLGVRVGRRLAATLATRRLSSPSAVRAFLDQLVVSSRGTGSTGRHPRGRATPAPSRRSRDRRRA